MRLATALKTKIKLDFQTSEKGQVTVKVTYLVAVWPDVEIKSDPICFKSCPKISQICFYFQE